MTHRQHTISFRFILCLTVFFFAKSIFLQAQLRSTYPVQVSTVVLSPAPIYLVDYSGGETDKLSVTLLSRDLNQSSLKVKLRLTLKCSMGQELVTKTEAYFEAITLEPGVPLRLTMQELAPYFRQENLNSYGSLSQGKLPLGSTQFCFEAVEYYTGKVLSTQSCGSTFLALQKPPLLVQPAVGKKQYASDNLNILFQWSPQHSLEVGTVEYEFTLKEIEDNTASLETAYNYSPVIYSTTTGATGLAYTMANPPLSANKKYAWSVRAFLPFSANASNIPFENNGNSTISWFQMKSPCTAPTNVQAATSDDKLILEWTPSREYSSYEVSYRRSDFDQQTWYQQQTQDATITLKDLTPGHTYLYRVGGFCEGQTEVTYGSSDSLAIPLNDSIILAHCGEKPSIELSNQEPKESLTQGDKIKAGDFSVTLTSVSGNHGIFSGEGYAVVPFVGNLPLAVHFAGIGVNTDNQLISGFIETKYDASNSGIVSTDVLFYGGTATAQAGIIKPDVTLAFSVSEQTRVQYDPESHTLLFYDATGNLIGSVEPSGDESDVSFPVIIQDKDGNTYEVAPADGASSAGGTTQKCVLTPLGKQGAALSDNAFNYNTLDTNKGMVTFFDEGGTYSFDTFLPYYDNVSLIRYANGQDGDRLYPKLSATYYVPWKFIPTGKKDKVNASVSLSDKTLEATKIVFETKEGLVIPSVYDAKKKEFELTLTGTQEGSTQRVYALYPYGSDKYYQLGQLRTDSHSTQTYKVVLVNAGGSYQTNTIGKELNALYNKIGINWEVEEVTDFSYDADQIKNLFDKNSGLLSAYNSEMVSLNNELKTFLGSRYDATACYVFMADKNAAGKKRDVVGFMPRGRQFAYMYAGDMAKDELSAAIAHELAHGKFKLRHTFDASYGSDRKEGENPTNLMDYRGGTHIAKWQWSQVYDPAILNGVFDNDEEGQLAILGGITWLGDLFWGLAPDAQEKSIEKDISLFNHVYQKYDSYFAASTTKNTAIGLTAYKKWSVRKESHAQTICKKIFEKLVKKENEHYTLVSKGVYVEKYTLENIPYQIAVYSPKGSFELDYDKIRLGSISELADCQYVKAGYTNTYGLISFYNAKQESIMTIQIIGGEPETAMLRWLNYLGLVVASDKQKEADKKNEEKLDAVNVKVHTEADVKDYWDGKEKTMSNNLRILYSQGIDISVITSEIEKMLYRIFNNAKINRTIIVTSTVRNSDNQAMAMIKVVKKKGLEAAKSLYNCKGDLVIDYYQSIKKSDESEVVRLMVIKMKEVGFLSAHSDWKKKGAIDFGENSNGFNGKYSNEVNPIIENAKKEPMVNPNQVFPPSSNEPALHIEIILNK